jgi:hypothetical protein
MISYPRATFYGARLEREKVLSCWPPDISQGVDRIHRVEVTQPGSQHTCHYSPSCSGMHAYIRVDFLCISLYSLSARTLAFTLYSVISLCLDDSLCSLCIPI